MTGRRRRNVVSAPARIAIVGANFAGLRAAQSLDDQYEVTVFDPSPWFEWLPNIHELVSGAKRPADLRLSRRRLIERAGHRFVRDTVVALDPRRGTLETSSGGAYDFDACIVAVGGVNETFGVRGADRHALPLRNVAQGELIRQRLATLAKDRAPRSVVIIGGGFAGVEVLGEILRQYRARKNLTIHVVDAAHRLMAGASPKIDDAIRGHCAGSAVQIHTGSPVAAVTPAAVRLQSGRRLRSDLTIWTGGGSAPPLLRDAGLVAQPRRWAPVTASLRSRRYRNVFVIGDAAGLPSPLAKQAFHALEMGECAADNVRRALAGRKLKVFSPSRTPLLVAFGDLDTFLVSGGSVLANSTLAAAKEAVFQVTMAQIDPPLSLPALGQLAGRVIGVTRRLARSR